jgi:peptidoglycan/LPS O-acetylase OafA/YrhL
MVYRREIDGLRAVAVSAVVLYHAGFGPRAGFVGVDVFFVISGYLITALLLREKSHTGRIDLADFYARRVRRIFPAAALVLLAVLAMVPILPPSARQGVIESAAAASLFGANVYFHLATSGYFTGDAGQLPLLHLWSLSVEEQFYLLWPALLMLGAGRRTFAMIAVASFALCEWLLIGHLSAAFYEMPARAWEMATGALIAASRPRALPRWAPWAGLCAVLAACVVPLPHFPGAGALPAVAGAALVLWAIHGGATSALLASRPFVGLGLISYSLYLWHWPLLAIDRLLRVGPSPWGTRAGIVALSGLLAFASYRYIETPLRKPWATSRRTVAAGFTVMAALACGAWAWRVPEPVKAPVVVIRCIPFAENGSRVQRPSCFGKERKVVLWGDSYAHAWTPLAEAVGERLHVPVTTWALDGCPPIVGVKRGLRSEGEAEACRAWNARALTYLQTNGADTLVLAARWQKFLPAGDLAATLKAVAPHVRRILIVGPTPTLTDEPTKCQALGSDCAVQRADFDANAAAAWATLRPLEAANVRIVDPAGWLCGPETCPGIRDGQALYSDTIHVSNAAAKTYGAQVAGVWN